MLDHSSFLLFLFCFIGVVVTRHITLPLKLLASIIAVLLGGNYISHNNITTLYTFSLLFKECLTFLLPVMVFIFVLHGILSLKKNAPLILMIMISFIFISNGFFAFLTYAIARLFIPHIAGHIDNSHLTQTTVIKPFIKYVLPQIVSTEYALIAAIALGLIFSVFKVEYVEYGVNQIKNCIEWILTRLFIPVLPLYVLGFLLKIHHEGMLTKLAFHYSGVFVLIIVLQLSCVIFIYICAAQGNISRVFTYMMNALPSYITAFGTMSSTATIPISIENAEKNTRNSALANVAMPIMANMHLLGDSVGIPILLMSTVYLFLGYIPSFSIYCVFVFYFCTSMFAVAGIPGGAVIVVIPLLIKFFEFTPDMVSIITALYLLIDPFGTGTNVMGDGALIILLNKTLKYCGLIKNDMDRDGNMK